MRAVRIRDPPPSPPALIKERLVVGADLPLVISIGIYQIHGYRSLIEAINSGLALLTVGNGTKGMRLVASRRAIVLGHSRQVRPPTFSSSGNSGEAMRGA